MKAHLTMFICCCGFLTHAQLSLGLKTGMSLGTKPGTAYCIVNRDFPDQQFLFNSQMVRFTPSAGAFARLDRAPFWFSAEPSTYGWNEKYTVEYTRSSLSALVSESNLVFNERIQVIELPLSIGVTLGMVEIFSGFSGTRLVSQKTELLGIEGFSSSTGKYRLGWHSGIGLNFSHFLIDLRYAQSFYNYGQGISVNGLDLNLKNARARVTLNLAVRVGNR